MKRSRQLVAILVAALAPPLASAADVFKGSQLYTSYCAGCHGMDGKGLLPGTPDFTQGMVLLRPDSMLVSSIRSGKGSMPGFLGILTEQNLFDVIAYLRTLQR